MVCRVHHGKRRMAFVQHLWCFHFSAQAGWRRNHLTASAVLCSGAFRFQGHTTNYARGASLWLDTPNISKVMRSAFLSSRNACATNSQKTGVRSCDGNWQHSHLVIVSEHAHNHKQATGLHNGPCDPRRNDVRLLVKRRRESGPRRTCPKENPQLRSQR